MRRGRVVERIELVTDPGALGSLESRSGAPDRSDDEPAMGAADLTECDVLQAALQQFYADRAAPPEIHVPVAFPDADTELLEGWLSDRARRRVRIVVPRRGEKRGLLDLAARNAEVAYQARFNENVAAHYDALETLRSVLALPVVPRRIECFDISTIQGSETVASMVVCEDGRMKRGEYRKFRIRGRGLGARGSGSQPRLPSVEPGRPRVEPRAPLARRSAERERSRSPDRHRDLDDFASMHEVVTRRYRRLLENGGPFPDLILIDGGKGQLSAAYEALESSGWAAWSPWASPRRKNCCSRAISDEPIALREDSPALLLIRRIRDEAHRFAVTFHRASRDEARSAIGARRDRRHRSAAAQSAADRVRQRRRRPPRHARRAGSRGRRQVGRRRAGALLDTVVAGVTFKRHSESDCPLTRRRFALVLTLPDASSDQSFGSPHL